MPMQREIRIRVKCCCHDGELAKSIKRRSVVLCVIQKRDYDEKTHEETQRELDSKDKYKQELGKELARVEHEKTGLDQEVAKCSEELKVLEEKVAEKKLVDK